MKKNLFLTLILGVMVVLPAAAQTGRELGTKWGKGQDSIDAIKNYANYRTQLNAGNVQDAFALWQKVFEAAPRGHKNIIVDGPKIYEKLIAQEQDAAKRSEYVNALLQVYKERITLYPADEAISNYYLAYAVRSYLPQTVENKKQLLGYFDTYFAKDLASVEAQDYQVYFATMVDLYSTADATAEELLDKYDTFSTNIDAVIAKGKNVEMWNQLKTYLDQSLIASGAANCENLVKLFGPQFDAKPDDLNLMKNIQKFLVRGNCVDESEEAANLFARVSEALYAKEPSAQAAGAMARLFMRNKDFTKALEYLDNALSEETDEANKADYYYQKGFIYANELNNYPEAKKNINAAIAIRQWGEPYILLATIYAAGSKNCGEDDFHKRAVYWLAVDKLQLAKRSDESVTEKADELIGQYSRYFPNKEDAFFYGVNPGDSVTIGCWIGERTTARF